MFKKNPTFYPARLDIVFRVVRIVGLISHWKSSSTKRVRGELEFDQTPTQTLRSRTDNGLIPVAHLPTYDAAPCYICFGRVDDNNNTLHVC